MPRSTTLPCQTGQIAGSAVGLKEIRLMLHITANAVAHGHSVFLPILERLEREYDQAQKSDPALYAQQLLKALGDENGRSEF